MIDQTITLGNIIEIGVIILGGFTVLITMRSTINVLQSDVTEMKAQIKKVGEVLTTLAVTNNRLDRVEQDIWELKHGEGFVLPLQRSKAVP